MKRRIWALVTGAIRSDLYFRIVMIKLCDMRAKGMIEQIVLSTWRGEIDKFPDLRIGLKKLNIILIEKPYIDETAETVFNYIAFARQRASIFYGVEVIPNDVYVLRLRTDFNVGIFSRGFIKFLDSNFSISVNRYGNFPVVFNTKVVVFFRSFRELMFPEDRYFFTSKETLNKMATFVSNYTMWRKGVCTDGQIMCGYIYQTHQLFRDIWNIIPARFYGYLYEYCRKNGNENLVLPRLIHRIYATVCVSLYTHYYIIGDDVCTDEPVSLIDLFSDKIRTRNQIERIVMGNVVESALSRVFKDELRKLALDLQEVHSYTYEEYEELCKFAEEKLQMKNLIQPYPYKDQDVKLCCTCVDKNEAGNILLKHYENNTFSDKIVSAIDDKFDFDSRDLYLKTVSDESKNSRLYIELWKMAIFERNLDAIYEYGRELHIRRNLFDTRTFLQAIRFLGIRASQNYKIIISIYDYLSHYGYFFKVCNEDKEIKNRLIAASNRVAIKIYPEGQKNKRIISAEEWIIFIVNALYQQLEGTEIPAVCIAIIQALLIIRPKESPFSKELIDKLNKAGKDGLVSQITDAYSSKQYNLGDWSVPVELVQLLQKKRKNSILMYASKLRGKVEARAMLQCLWNMLWILHEDEKGEVIDVIESISTLFAEPPFIVKANRFIKTNRIDISKYEMIEDDNFVVLLEILYKKEILHRNLNIVTEMCFGDRERKMMLLTFLRFETDKRIDFFSMKSGCELWFYYVPYVEHEKNKALQVSVNGDNRTWPWAERENYSAFAAFTKLVGNDVFISIEMSAKDMVKVRAIAESVGYEEKNSHSNLIRFKTEHFPFKDEKDLPNAVNKALDEFCKVGEKVVAVLDRM